MDLARRDILFEQYKGLADGLAQRMWTARGQSLGSSLCKEDLIQSARLCLLELLARLKESRGEREKTAFLQQGVRYCLMDLINDAALADDGAGRIIQVEDTGGIQDRTDEDVGLQLDVRQEVGKLPAAEREICRMLSEGLRPFDIAEALGDSLKNVLSRIRGIREQLKELVSDG